MPVLDDIRDYISSLPEAKSKEIEALHKQMVQTYPEARLWFLDGKDEYGKVVTNPNIGYGQYTIRYADGSEREFYRVGISANSAGISVYIMGIEDKTYLLKTFGEAIGDAKVTGYCIKFKSISKIDESVLFTAMKFGMDRAE